MIKTELSQMRKLWDEYNHIVAKSGKATHPHTFLIMHFGELLKRFSENNQIVFIHAKYCKEHDPDIKEWKRRGEVLAQAIRDLNANKNYPYDFENLSQALSTWEKTQ